MNILYNSIFWIILFIVGAIGFLLVFGVLKWLKAKMKGGRKKFKSFGVGLDPFFSEGFGRYFVEGWPKKQDQDSLISVYRTSPPTPPCQASTSTPRTCTVPLMTSEKRSKPTISSPIAKLMGLPPLTSEDTKLLAIEAQEGVPTYNVTVIPLDPRDNKSSSSWGVELTVSSTDVNVTEDPMVVPKSSTDEEDWQDPCGSDWQDPRGSDLGDEDWQEPCGRDLGEEDWQELGKGCGLDQARAMDPNKIAIPTLHITLFAYFAVKDLEYDSGESSFYGGNPCHESYAYHVPESSFYGGNPGHENYAYHVPESSFLEGNSGQENYAYHVSLDMPWIDAVQDFVSIV